jgi:hypothetical protein
MLSTIFAPDALHITTSHGSPISSAWRNIALAGSIHGKRGKNGWAKVMGEDNSIRYLKFEYGILTEVTKTEPTGITEYLTD